MDGGVAVFFVLSGVLIYRPFARAHLLDEARAGEEPVAALVARDRQHARIIRDGNGGLTVEDLGSRNGTFLNGERLTMVQPLKPGDRIIAIDATATPRWRDAQFLFGMNARQKLDVEVDRAGNMSLGKLLRRPHVDETFQQPINRSGFRLLRGTYGQRQMDDAQRQKWLVELTTGVHYYAMLCGVEGRYMAHLTHIRDIIGLARGLGLQEPALQAFMAAHHPAGHAENRQNR